jgi:hypothetical protein
VDGGIGTVAQTHARLRGGRDRRTHSGRRRAGGSLWARIAGWLLCKARDRLVGPAGETQAWMWGVLADYVACAKLLLVAAPVCDIDCRVPVGRRERGSGRAGPDGPGPRTATRTGRRLVPDLLRLRCGRGFGREPFPDPPAQEEPGRAGKSAVVVVLDTGIEVVTGLAAGLTLFWFGSGRPAHAA